jgi:hypothetical protein
MRPSACGWPALPAGPEKRPLSESRCGACPGNASVGCGRCGIASAIRPSATLVWPPIIEESSATGRRQIVYRADRPPRKIAPTHLKALKASRSAMSIAGPSPASASLSAKENRGCARRRCRLWRGVPRAATARHNARSSSRYRPRSRPRPQGPRCRPRHRPF